MYPASLKVAFLFGKSACQKSWSYSTFSRIILATICKRLHSKTPHRYLTILKCLNKSHLGKIINLTKSSNLLRQGLGILVTISEPCDLFKCGLLPITKRTFVVMKNDPRFHSHTLFSKRKATFKTITEFALAAMGFQLFRENHGKMCTQIIDYTEINVWYFSTGSFACYPQEHFPWWTWPRVTDPGPGSP